MSQIIGYARISSDDGQDATSQVAMLEKAGAVVVLTDVGSGASLAGRSQLESAIRLMSEGSVLLAVAPDRLARDTSDLLSIAKRVVERGAKLRVLDPPISFDGSDIMAEAMLTLFGLIGKIERHFIRARQRRGIEMAKAQGRYKGRPSTINVSDVRRLKASGLGASEIARTLKIGRASVYRAINAEPTRVAERGQSVG